MKIVIASVHFKAFSGYVKLWQFACTTVCFSTPWINVRNKEVLLRVNEQRNILHEIRKRKAYWIGHILRRNCLLQQVIEGKLKGQIEVTRRRGRRRKKLLDDLKDRRGYCQLKEEALDRTVWRNRFGRGFGPVVWQITDDDDDGPTSPFVFCAMKSRRMRWAGHVAHMGEERGVYRVLVGKPEGKRPLGRPRCRWVDNIRMDLQELGCGYVDWPRTGTGGGRLWVR